MIRAAALVDDLIARGVVGGAQLAVADASGVRFEHLAGHADRDRAVPVTADTRFALASLTKPLVATAALVAHADGTLDLDEPIALLLPTVAPWITMRMLLAHYSGLPEGATIAPAEWAELRLSYAAVAPVCGPAERRLYSNPAYAIAGAALEVAAGLPIDRLIVRAVAGPLGLERTTLGLPVAADGAWVRDAGLVSVGVPLFNDPWFRRQPLPQSGGWSTASDYATFLAAVLRGGAPLLPGAVAAELLTNQGGALAGGVESFMTWPRADWAIGFELRSTKERHWTGAALSPRAATHFGASGTLCFVDPAAEMAAALLCNRGTYSGWMLADGAWPAIVAAIVSAS